jgi:hypothetical protein
MIMGGSLKSWGSVAIALVYPRLFRSLKMAMSALLHLLTSTSAHSPDVAHTVYLKAIAVKISKTVKRISVPTSRNQRTFTWKL